MCQIRVNRRQEKQGKAFGPAEQTVLCGSLWDAQTYWNHGYRIATCMFGAAALSSDMMEALEEFNIKRVVTTCAARTAQLLEDGVEVFLVQPPADLDVYADACQVDAPADGLGGRSGSDADDLH